MPEPIAIITTVGKEYLGWRQDLKDQPRTLVIAHLPFGEQEDDRSAEIVADGVQLRIQPTLRATNVTG